MVHLVEAQAVDIATLPQIEHFAFRARGLRASMDRLDALGLAYNLFLPPGAGVVSLNLRDPDDNRLHLDFPLEEHEPGMVPARLSLR